MPKKPSRQANPVQTAVQRWITALSQRDDRSLRDLLPPEQTEESWSKSLSEAAPKRYTIYAPMALLPSGSFANEPWASLMARPGGLHLLEHLWTLILQELSRASRSAVTHLAVNEGIPLHQDGGQAQAAENVRRSPSSLRMLHGDFGPGGTGGEPAEEDFERALWVATKQNGIHQTWAPRWTMFSRGNIKEKARVLGFGKPRLEPLRAHAQGEEQEERRQRQQQQGRGAPRETWAVDLYAGIGYFTFSYAALGMRVLCWEINPWSVEALRRGARANRWSVRVVRGRDLERPLGEVMAGGEQIVVFLESNERAAARVRQLQDLDREEGGIAREGVVHVNCGFLPSSEPSWRAAWEVTRSSPEAWLHLHENVGVADLEARRQSIQAMFDGWAASASKEGEGEGEIREPVVEHIEQVKTFAPGVWHCVYDVHLVRKRKPVI